MAVCGTRRQARLRAAVLLRVDARFVDLRGVLRAPVDLRAVFAVDLRAVFFAPLPPLLRLLAVLRPVVDLLAARFFGALFFADLDALLRLDADRPLDEGLRSRTSGVVFLALPRPEPLFLPPRSCRLTVAHARCSAVSSDTPRSL